MSRFANTQLRHLSSAKTMATAEALLAGQPGVVRIADLLSDLSHQLLQSMQQPGLDQTERTGRQTAALVGICAAQSQLEQALPDYAGTSQEGKVLERRRILDSLLEDSQAAAWDMATCIDRNTVANVPEHCDKKPTLESVQRTLALAHRLSYTSFAPAGFQPGVTQLHAFRPPAPQEWQMRSAQLHQFAEEVRQQALKEQLPSAIGSGAQSVAPPTAAAAASVAQVPKPALVSSLQQSSDANEGATPEEENTAAPGEAADRLARPVVEASFLDLNVDFGMQVSEEETSEDFSEDSD